MGLNVDHLLRTAATLEQALLAIDRTPPDQPVMLLPDFLGDVRTLAGPLQQVFDANA